MKNDELKKALFEGTPVIYNGITYDKINAVIYRVNKDGFTVSAELLDRSRYCVVIADVEKIEVATDAKNAT